MKIKIRKAKEDAIPFIAWIMLTDADLEASGFLGSLYSRRKRENGLFEKLAQTKAESFCHLKKFLPILKKPLFIREFKDSSLKK